MYKEIKNRIGKEGFWLSKETGYKDKQKWARLKCGNVGRAENIGFEDVTFRFCKEEKESLLHIQTCENAREKIDAIWIEEVDEWLNQGKQNGDIKEILIKTLSGEPRLGLCRYARSFGKIAREELDNNEYERENERIEGNEGNLLLD